MVSRERAVDRGQRNGSRLVDILGRELRDARVASGLSQGAVGRAVGVSHTTISRIERGVDGDANVVTLARVSAVLGLELAARVYPSGPPLRDAAHLALLARFRRNVHPSLKVRAEVPLPQAGDPRAWDLVVYGAGWRVAVEAETRLSDVQALERRLALKQRDAEMPSVIVVVAATRSNRAVLRTVGAPAGHPLATHAVLDALRAGREPAGNATVLV